MPTPEAIHAARAAVVEARIKRAVEHADCQRCSVSGDFEIHEDLLADQILADLYRLEPAYETTYMPAWYAPDTDFPALLRRALDDVAQHSPAATGKSNFGFLKDAIERILDDAQRAAIDRVLGPPSARLRTQAYADYEARRDDARMERGEAYQGGGAL